MINFPFIQLWLLNTRSQTVLLTSLIVLRKFIAVVHFTTETFFLSICSFSYSTSLHFKPFFSFPQIFTSAYTSSSVAPFPTLSCFYAPAFLIFFPPCFHLLSGEEFVLPYRKQSCQSPPQVHKLLAFELSAPESFRTCALLFSGMYPQSYWRWIANL